MTTQPQDGNAIAGALHEAFGGEMTTRTGACEHCGAVGPTAQLHVYTRAPRIIARCPNCGSVVLVLTDAGGRPSAGVTMPRTRLTQ